MATTSNESPPVRRYHSPMTGAGFAMIFDPLRASLRCYPLDALTILVDLRDGEFK